MEISVFKLPQAGPKEVWVPVDWGVSKALPLWPKQNLNLTPLGHPSVFSREGRQLEDVSRGRPVEWDGVCSWRSPLAQHILLRDKWRFSRGWDHCFYTPVGIVGRVVRGRIRLKEKQPLGIRKWETGDLNVDFTDFFLGGGQFYLYLKFLIKK